MRDPRGFAIAAWGVGGVVLLILRALATLTPIALEALSADGFGVGHGLVTAAWVATNAYAEGYRGFHLRFSPRTVERALYLAAHPSPLRVVLAPAYCMGLFDASRRTLVSSWALVLAIVLLVVVVGRVPQPWRGIIDAGVVVGLALGTASLLWIFLRDAAIDPKPAPTERP